MIQGAWPKVYYESQAVETWSPWLAQTVVSWQVLRSLLGKKGSCPAGRVAVVGQAEAPSYGEIGEE